MEQTITMKAEDFYQVGKLLLKEAIGEEKPRRLTRLISRKEAAQMLCVSVSTLCHWDKTGYLKSIPVGGLRKYRKYDIEQMLRKR